MGDSDGDIGILQILARSAISVIEERRVRLAEADYRPVEERPLVPMIRSIGGPAHDPADRQTDPSVERRQIPQLCSVVIGDMSLVGPCVMPSREVNLYTDSGQALRRDMLPALTGFWQVEHRSDSDFKVREIADSFYVANWSVWLDIWIVLRTFEVVLSGRGGGLIPWAVDAGRPRP